MEHHFQYFERRRGPQMSRGPGKRISPFPPLDGPGLQPILYFIGRVNSELDSQTGLIQNRGCMSSRVLDCDSCRNLLT